MNKSLRFNISENVEEICIENFIFVCIVKLHFQQNCQCTLIDYFYLQKNHE